MNTKIIVATYLILSFCLFSCQENKRSNSIESEQNYSQENLDGSITIQGKVTLKGNQKAPLGVTTMNVKNKWVYTKDMSKPSAKKKRIALGENKRVFINKDGYYKITISKNDTLALIPAPYLYKAPKHITGLTKSQTINIELEALPLETVEDFKKQNPLGYQVFYNQLKSVNPDSLITISGTVYSAKSKKPLNNISVATSFIANTNGVATFRLTDKYGQFTIQSPKNNHIVINGLARNYVSFVAINDTIINIKL
ncbi:hypothetical protein [Myroides pelagicus]|uniref:Uncharacterized protein n=1 Tax=Myroides pelagicus TaxID=270914 RepID=A0A7K1GRN2_9FLAO|nr:hypothetical protein [Myroides pelagicus]MTH31029.1 hypothetical protein [Myroides pelagicus]